MNFILVIQAIALICLFFAALNLFPTTKVSWFPLGMFLWLLSLMIGSFSIHTTRESGELRPRVSLERLANLPQVSHHFLGRGLLEVYPDRQAIA
jgi:hypothetical protein